MSVEKQDLYLVINEGSDENLALIIHDLYEEIERTAGGVMGRCAKHFGWLGWDLRAEAEKADATLRQAATASDEARRGHIAALCEVLDGERLVLEQYRKLLLTRKPLVMLRLMVESALTRTAWLLERACPYRG
jgi:hypothetical protein